MTHVPDNPLIVQSDKTALLEVDNPRYTEVRDFMARFAELEKSPEHIHTYRITPLSLWNAASTGMSADAILEGLEKHSKYDLPGNVRQDIRDYVSRYGRVKLKRLDDKLVLWSDDRLLITELCHHKKLKKYIDRRIGDHTLEVPPGQRGFVKQALIEVGYPAEDLAGYAKGAALELDLRGVARGGRPFALRQYQREAVDIFYASGSEFGGSGVIVLPCGAGKTIVGLGVVARFQCQTLILCPNTIAARQWQAELLDKTTLDPSQIGEYTGSLKEIRPITIATYQILTHRKKKEGPFTHFKLFEEKDWGLIVYDEVHLLPAPVFQVTAHIQALRRLGLTATLIREDGKEKEVFSLIGPKKLDVPWKALEKQGWIASAECTEIRAPMPDDKLRFAYATAEDRDKYRIAAENPCKFDIVDLLLRLHPGDQVLVIGQFIEQLKTMAARINAPVITGATSNLVRERLYRDFRAGKIKRLVVSKVGNFAIDLPDANVAVQISGTFGSRQEEAQRLGRILRPKSDGSTAHFYSIVTQDTRDQDFGAKRQLFLTEQGYHYRIVNAAEFEREILEVIDQRISVRATPPPS